MTTLDLIPGIQYHPYSALIAHMDWEVSLQSKPEGKVDVFTVPTRTSDVFTRACVEYRAGLVNHSAIFDKANKSQSRPFESFLYNPACFVTFGINDCVGIVAIDDFDPAFRLASDLDIPVRQTCLAFCPKLDSLEVTNSRSVFAELSDICDGRPPELTATGKALVPATAHPFLKGRPLVAVTYYKLNGMAILGPGLLMQQAVYKVMADEIEKVLQKLDAETDPAGPGGNKHVDIKMSNENVKSFRCVFLDPQGWADIATVIVCQNYSVIGCVLAAMRRITFGQLYEKEAALEQAVRSFGIHEMMAGKGGKALLESNHIFWSLYTTLGMTHETVEQGRDQQHRYSGVVIADTQLKLYPGHVQDVLRVAPLQYSAHGKKVSLKHHDYLWYTIGHNDFLFEQLANKKHETDQAMELSELLEQAKCMLDSRDRKGAKLYEADSKPFMEHVLDAYTDIRVPVPIGLLNRTETNKRRKENHRYIPYDLAQMRHNLFGEEKPLSIKTLRDKIRELRIPAPLSKSIIYLYNDFAKYLCYPFIFESVLDLFDIFRTTYLLLTEKWPKSLAADCRHDYQCRAFISNEDTNQLLELVELLQDALNNRIQIVFPEAERWNITIDVRGGGLHRLVNAADTLLKCGMAILWRVMCGWTDVYVPTEQDVVAYKERQTGVAGALRISQNPRSLGQRIKIGSYGDVFLASVNLNISHLTRPSALCIHLHEAAHLIWDLIRDQQTFYEELGKTLDQAIQQRNLNSVQQKSYASAVLDRCEDIFAEILVHCFLFDEKDGHVTYFRQYVANYSFDPVAYCKESKNTFLRMLEVLIRGFLATDPFRVQKDERFALDKDLYLGYCKEELNTEMIERAYARFKDAVEDAGPFFFEFSRLWPDDDNTDAWAYLREQFSRTYTESYKLVCDIWSTVNQMYSGICKGKPNEAKLGIDPPQHVNRDHIQRQIREGLTEGKPLSRSLQIIPGYEEEEERFKYLNSFFLLRQLLREHIKGLFGPATVNTERKTVLLSRKARGGMPDFDPETLSKGRTGWHHQLVDHSSNRLFTVGAEARSRYMKSRIVVIKTLWDISTNYRARRMKDVLEMCH